jgi:uroporphyrinogen decarboxylase
MPIAVYPGASLIHQPVSALARDGALQAQASEALRAHLGLPFALAAMDLSVEAEAFGARVIFEEGEIPTVIERRVTSAEEIADLALPRVGAGRTSVALEAVRWMRARGAAPLVIACSIGPFSLAGRLFGVSETLELTLLEPETTHALVAKAADFLGAMVAALRDAGAHAVLMAEPTAGLLSPAGLAEFSSPYVKRIREGAERDGFSVILHNCGARLAHLSAILESGAQALHFGAPMDLAAARAQAPDEVVLCGNLDPAAVFVRLAPDAAAEATRRLMEAVGHHPGIVFSSGCDVPPSASIETLTAFVRTVESGGRNT